MVEHGRIIMQEKYLTSFTVNGKSENKNNKFISAGPL
jgi:hypothetical protein